MCKILVGLFLLSLIVQLYIDGEYVGDNEVVCELNECGELVTMLKGCEVWLPSLSLYSMMIITWYFMYTHIIQRRKASHVCLLCQGEGFLVCLWCKGTKKGMQTNFCDLKCTVCNQNALQKCPECSM